MYSSHQYLSTGTSLKVSIHYSALRANKLAEQIWPLKIKDSVSSYIMQHSKDEICHHIPSPQSTIKCKTTSTESVELAWTALCGDLHISENRSFLCICKNTLHFKWLLIYCTELFLPKWDICKCRLFIICYWQNSHLQSQWKHFFPRILNDVDSQLVMQDSLLETSPSKVCGTE